MFKFGSKSEERMEGVNPNMLKVAYRALEISSKRKKRRVDFTIPKLGGVRTTPQQAELYKKKRSKADGVNKLSRHQIKKGEKYGTALDVIAYVPEKGGGTYDEEYLNDVACCMMQASIELGIPIEWGGAWRTFYDPAHYQLA